ncbi:hypothetical protein W97_08043 [Coniosporium apollinis CBS 100218]|uniref:Uncharacterized protein n=1 Tax=Coniosporium apollinis (strain CBS 100218) TaxID=1168221 RepID=R7Z3L0_CONA1|nr:uncharacterized protein W97_08043 [Coniosporium apollinis CBS 100218]EON68785.1 hypothetical protein W97_08043 [Coniosporium apollinis CBS 100218]
MSNTMLKQTTQAVVLSVTSNILAQALTAYREDKSFALDLPPIIRFTLFTALNTPPNILWQQYLEERFPSHASPSTTTAIEPLSADEKDAPNGMLQNGDTKPTTTSPAHSKTSSINIPNILTKFALDQTLGALVNTVLFVVGIRSLSGASTVEILTAVKTETYPLMSAGWKLWPLVSLLSFSVVPVDKRVLFGSLVGLFWGIYVSILMT